MDGLWRRAPGAMPERGNAEPRRGAGCGGRRPLVTLGWPAFRISKVTRCKSGTLSSRDRSNGYVHRTVCSQVKSISRFGEDCVLVRSLAALDSGYRFRRSGPSRNCLLLRCSKVSRCKSGTLSSRDRSNGYVRRTVCSQVKSISRFGEDCVLVRSLAALDSGYRFWSGPSAFATGGVACQLVGAATGKTPASAAVAPFSPNNPPQPHRHARRLLRTDHISEPHHQPLPNLAPQIPL
ncbi:hypothetical protein SAMN03159354_02713 [Pseudomonas sp. NFPP19]|nr:hypothetical protein SAMN03159354_02713 [Pseudomonas sp. NFPP19]